MLPKVGSRPGDAGGVRGQLLRHSEEYVGGRYVIQIALCTPVRSSFGAMKLMVTSPGEPPSSSASNGIRRTASGFLSSHLGRVATLLVSKYFQFRITFEDAGSASTIVLPPLVRSVFRVFSWQ